MPSLPSEYASHGECSAGGRGTARRVEGRCYTLQLSSTGSRRRQSGCEGRAPPGATLLPPSAKRPKHGTPDIAVSGLCGVKGATRGGRRGELSDDINVPLSVGMYCRFVTVFFIEIMF